jgi:hypothetical protein
MAQKGASNIAERQQSSGWGTEKTTKSLRKNHRSMFDDNLVDGCIASFV